MEKVCSKFPNKRDSDTTKMFISTYYFPVHEFPVRLVDGSYPLRENENWSG